MAETKVLLFHKDTSVLRKLSQSLGGSQYSIISSSDLQYTLELARQEDPQFLIWGEALNTQTKKTAGQQQKSLRHAVFVLNK